MRILNNESRRRSRLSVTYAVDNLYVVLHIYTVRRSGESSRRRVQRQNIEDAPWR